MAVALAEEMPVNETLELEESLRTALSGVGLATIVANGIYPRRFSAGDMRRLGELPEPSRDGLAAARCPRRAPSTAGWRASRLSCGALRRQATAPVLTLPFLFSPQLGQPSWSGWPASWTASLSQA